MAAVVEAQTQPKTPSQGLPLGTIAAAVSWMEPLYNELSQLATHPRVSQVIGAS